MASHDLDININIYGESMSVDIANFGRIVLATEEVEAGFTEDYRLYTSNRDAQADTDLSAPAMLALAAFFSQELRPPDIAVAPVTYATLDTDLDALLIAWSEFYGVVCDDRTQATQDDLATWVAANGRIGSIQSSDAAITAGTPANLFEDLQADNNNRAFGTWHDDDDEFVDLDWLATILSCDLDSQSSVAHDKELVGCSAPGSADIDATKKAVVEGLNGNLYLPFKGGSVMRPGVLFGGDWIEDKIIEDWFEARLGEGIAALAKRQSMANSKIAYDDDGIALCEGVIRAVVAVGVKAGHFVKNSLVLDVPKLVDISAVTRATKTVTIAGTVQKAGAIKDFNFNIGITF